MKLEISQSTIDTVRAVSEQNEREYESQKTKSQWATLSEMHNQNPTRHRLTHAEAVDRAALLAMFDQLDSRGQKTTLAMLAVAVKLHPRS